MSNGKMTPEQFCYWLNGHFDLSELDALTEKQVIVIRQHLAMVFDKQADSVKDINFDFNDIKKTISTNRPSFPNITLNDTKIC